MTNCRREAADQKRDITGKVCPACPSCRPPQPANESGYCDICEPMIEQELADIELQHFIADIPNLAPAYRQRLRDELERRYP